MPDTQQETFLPKVVQQPAPDRQVKSSVFIDLFALDPIVGKQNFLSLYNAIHGTSYKIDNTRLELKNIDRTVYKTFANDIGMLIDNKLVVMIEHQSTLNENMPFRFLEYISRIYSSMVPANRRYYKNKYYLPTPEFIVIYTGKDSFPDTQELKLSDSFLKSTSIAGLELKVQVLNANSTSLPVVQNCDILKEYLEFIQILYTYSDMKTPESCTKAIQLAIDKGLLKNYLERKVTEVINMFEYEYSYEEDVAAQREEAEAIGEARGEAKGEARGEAKGEARGKTEVAVNMLQKNLPIDIIAEVTGIPQDQLQALKANL